MDNLVSGVDIDSILEGTSAEESSKGLKEKKGNEYQEREVRKWDFTRPEKLSGDHRRTLMMIHERFARHAASTLSSLLGCSVNVRFLSSEQLSYQEFVGSLPNPSLLAQVDMNPLPGRSLVELDRDLAFVMLDRLFGGQGDPVQVKRNLSEIEKAVVENILSQILADLSYSWVTIVDFRPKMVALDYNPQFVTIAPPNEMVSLTTLEVSVLGEDGLLNICFPYVTIEPILPKLSLHYWYSNLNDQTYVDDPAPMKGIVMSLEVPVEVEVGRARIPVREVLQLGIGDVVKLDRNLGKPLLLKLGGKPKFTCLPGTFGSNVAIRIDHPISD